MAKKRRTPTKRHIEPPPGKKQITVALLLLIDWLKDSEAQEPPRYPHRWDACEKP